MAFQKLPGNKGLVYVPECCKCPRKHPCPDCYSCQWCSNDRCNRCRGCNEQKPKKKKTR